MDLFTYLINHSVHVLRSIAIFDIDENESEQLLYMGTSLALFRDVRHGYLARCEVAKAIDIYTADGNSNELKIYVKVPSNIEVLL